MKIIINKKDIFRENRVSVQIIFLMFFVAIAHMSSMSAGRSSDRNNFDDVSESLNESVAELNDAWNDTKTSVEESTRELRNRLDRANKLVTDKNTRREAMINAYNNFSAKLERGVKGKLMRDEDLSDVSKVLLGGLVDKALIAGENFVHKSLGGRSSVGVKNSRGARYEDNQEGQEDREFGELEEPEVVIEGLPEVPGISGNAPTSWEIQNNIKKRGLRKAAQGDDTSNAEFEELYPGQEDLSGFETQDFDR